MASKKLTFPLARRHDTKFILDGVVKIEGYDIEIIDTGALPWPFFADMVTKISYDIGEQALSHYLLARNLGKPLTAVPVFPSYFFPQMGAAVNINSGIKTAADLAGKRVGVPSVGYNPSMWFQSILKTHYGVDPASIQWVEDANDPFLGGVPYARPLHYKIDSLPQLSAGMIQTAGIFPGEYLADGRIDAVLMPAGGPAPSATTGRLFADPMKEIEAFVKNTGIFPINTVITMTNKVVAENPGLPVALVAAFDRAKALYNEEARAGKETIHMGLDIEFLKRIGVFPTKYGIDANHAALNLITSEMAALNYIKPVAALTDIFASGI